jgi:hypothetical protein
MGRRSICSSSDRGFGVLISGDELQSFIREYFFILMRPAATYHAGHRHCKVRQVRHLLTFRQQPPINPYHPTPNLLARPLGAWRSLGPIITVCVKHDNLYINHVSLNFLKGVFIVTSLLLTSHVSLYSYHDCH